MQVDRLKESNFNEFLVELQDISRPPRRGRAVERGTTPKHDGPGTRGAVRRVEPAGRARVVGGGAHQLAGDAQLELGGSVATGEAGGERGAEAKVRDCYSVVLGIFPRSNAPRLETDGTCVASQSDCV